MFAYNEKISLTVMNVRDKSGKLLPINIALPLNNGIINLPENVSQLSIIEFHEGIEIYGHRVFNIYVGQTGTFDEIINKNKKIRIKDNFYEKIKSSKEQLAYNETEYMIYILGLVQGNDIVVKKLYSIFSAEGLRFIMDSGYLPELPSSQAQHLPEMRMYPFLESAQPGLRKCWHPYRVLPSL